MISIIIPACNEERLLGKTLSSVIDQKFKDYEIIVVCNGCDDKTETISRWFKAKTLVTPERNTSKARNLGAKLASGNKLVFLDADTRLTKGSLEKIAKIDAKIGVSKGMPDNDRFIAKMFFRIKNRLWWTGWSSGLIFIDKGLFDKMGGFDENLSKGEDGKIIRTAKKVAKFGLADTFVINSMRRFEEWGYFNVCKFWIKERFFPSDKEYELIR